MNSKDKRQIIEVCKMLLQYYRLNHRKSDPWYGVDKQQGYSDSLAVLRRKGFIKEYQFFPAQITTVDGNDILLEEFIPREEP